MASEQVPEPLRLRLRIAGADIEPGKIPFRDLKRLAELAQTGVERTARVMSGPRTPSRKTTKELQDATELLLIGIEPGSAVAVAELKTQHDDSTQEHLPSLPTQALGVRAVEAFIDGLKELETALVPGVPERWDNSVMEVAEQLVRFTRDRRLTLDISTDSRTRPTRTATITGDQAERFSSRHTFEPRRRSVRGELVLIDLDTGRIDIKDLLGRRTHCTFVDSARDQVLSLVGHQVLATGEEDVETSTGKASALRIESLADAGEQMEFGEDFWRNPSAAEQATEQGTRPISAVTDLADPLFDDAEVDAFLDEIRGS